MVTLSQVIQFLSPNSRSPYDWAVADTGSGSSLAYWNTAKLGPQPTADQIAAATEQLESIQSGTAQLATWFATNLTPGDQAQFAGLQQAVISAIGAQNWTLVYQLISTVTPPSTELATKQAALLALAVSLNLATPAS